MEVPPFYISTLPRIVFGDGNLAKVPDLAHEFGSRALFIVGRGSFERHTAWPPLLQKMRNLGMTWEIFHVEQEPSPELIDSAVSTYRQHKIDVVIGLGGGSVLDAAKAIAGLLVPGNSVMDHLEGVGRDIPYTGPAVPFIAIPTTAGTGSEATKNAVISVVGAEGFKKSFRHELLVPKIAVIDPTLLASCPPELIAANGMDALTQLLESYVSAKANPFSDALAWSGLIAVRDGLLPWFEHNHPQARAQMAYGALLSGITLAQVGLGSVHGLASPLGAFFPIPHGAVCGTLVATATEINIDALKARTPAHPSLAKYAEVGRLLSGKSSLSDLDAQRALVDVLADWTHRLRLPMLSAFGVTLADVPRIVKNARGSSMQTNPIVLTDEEIGQIVIRRLAE